MRVKVCGMTDPHEAEGALRLGVDYLGLNLWPKTPRCVPQHALPSLKEIIPWDKRVYVDVAPEPEKLAALKEDFAAFQIHFPWDTPSSRVAAWMNLVGQERLWLAPKCPPEIPFPEVWLDYASHLLLDAYRKDAFGGTGHTANWEQFRALKHKHPHKRWILAGGLSPENLAEAVARSSTEFVDLNSGIETAPGRKDLSRLRLALAHLGRTIA